MKRILFFVAFTLMFAACDPSEDTNNYPIPDVSDAAFAQNFGAQASRDFIGQVVDNENHALAGVSVTIGSSSVQTDLNGIFVVRQATVYEKFAYIKASKPGYIDGSRSMVPTSSTNNVRIMLLPATTVATISSGATATVTLTGGAKVVFDGAFADADGIPYSGDVSVSLFHLETSDDDIGSLMPGMLYGKSGQGQAVGLESFGMLHAQLTGSAGQKIQLATGHSAQITMPVDAAQSATAPSSIPLWHFDEVNGYWKQEGSATKQGNAYVGNVSHFSWWNCDAPFPTHSLTVTIVGVDGNPLPHAKVGLLPNGGISEVSGQTDDNGKVSGMIPRNQTLTLNVYSDCGIAYTTTIGPFNADTSLPAIHLSGASANATLMKGVLKKCDGSNVTNGYIIMSSNGGDKFINISNGSFNFNTIFCSSLTSLSLRGIDLDNLQTVVVNNHAITTPITNIGNLTACNSISNYVSYQVDDQPVTYLFTGLFGGYNSPELLFSAGSITTPRLQVVGNTLVPGIYDSSVFQLFDSLGGFYAYANQNLTYNLIAFGSVGQLLHMTFSGTFDDNYGVTHTVSGTIHVLRNQ